MQMKCTEKRIKNIGSFSGTEVPEIKYALCLIHRKRRAAINTNRQYIARARERERDRYREQYTAYPFSCLFVDNGDYKIKVPSLGTAYYSFPLS